MCSRFLNSCIGAVFLLCTGTITCSNELRVCADPDNLPFSNEQKQGFENRIAQIVANDLQSQLAYIWQRMGRGFVREYLDKSRCDVLIGIPRQYRSVLTTSPYYRSTYVFVTRKKDAFHPASLDDPKLGDVKVGVQALDEEYTPAAEALARRGWQSSLVGFYSVGSHADEVVQAVVRGQVQVAIVWGPIAGYAAQRFRNQLEITPVRPEFDPPGLPLTFEISMGVRKGNGELRAQLENVLRERAGEIQGILASYGVPELPISPTKEVGR